MTSSKPHFQIVTVGTALRDIVFKTNAGEIVRNPKHDPTKLRLLGFEYGAKIHSADVHYHDGGGAANTAVSFARLRLRTAIITRVGNDGIGEELVRHFKQERIATDLVQSDSKQHSGVTFLVMDHATNEHVAFVYYGANEGLTITSATLKHFSTDWFYVPALSMSRWDVAMRTLINTDSKIAWNPGAIQLNQPQVMKRLLPNVELVILNKDEAIELSLKTGFKTSQTAFTVIDLTKHIAQLGAKLVLITDGRKGAYVYDGQQHYFQKASPNKPVDTIGAGDCYGSSFVAGLIKLGSIPAALKLATINVTAKIAKEGAQQGLLSWKNISKLLHQTKR